MLWCTCIVVYQSSLCDPEALAKSCDAAVSLAKWTRAIFQECTRGQRNPRQISSGRTGRLLPLHRRKMPTLENCQVVDISQGADVGCVMKPLG